MKELHFQRTGRLLVATEGEHRFVLHSVPPDEGLLRWTAELHRREGASKKPIASERFASKAQAIEWLSKHRASAPARANR